MPSDKEIKKEFKAKASLQPEKFYPISVLNEEGFSREKCTVCGTFFWTTEQSRTVCDDPSHSGGFRFFDNPPAKKELDYVGVWKEFAKHFKKRGYTPIERYPVAARWRTDTDFVQASIYDFQPYVVSGEVEPPANPLTVPQLCLRFNDIDNVGITGAHYSCFVMIGQHAFEPPEKYNQKKYFEDIHSWLKEGLGLPNEEITYHEDAWAGGGNFGPCIEFFSRGLELGNQVYMMYEQTPAGSRELNLKVLDMGMGQERNAWFTKGTSTSYETTFPTVAKKLYKTAGIKVDREVVRRFLPYSAYLNVDEVEDINSAWKRISEGIGIDSEKLKNTIQPLAELYSVAEHSRALLVALSDGVLPSNVGGGYNLRLLFRRAQGFIDKHGWKVSIPEICEWHAVYLKKQFPELSGHLKEVNEILEVEKKKYYENKKRSAQIVGNALKTEITEQKLVELYDSQGISPEFIREEAEKLGKKIVIPDKFYSLVSEMHEKEKQLTQTKREEKLALSGIPATEILYFDNYKLAEFKANVLKVIGSNAVLDRTAFYPTSGGQLADAGTINGNKIIDVFKQGNIVVHAVDRINFREGDTVKGIIDLNRRKQLAQHHTATHILNGTAKKVLGNHVWQAGAAKFIDKARLDITHFENLTKEQVEEIEKIANGIIRQNIKVHKFFLPRNLAEKKYGFGLYQGGAVPGKEIRVVEIPGFDVEACGGTHLDSTGEAEVIRIIKTSKVQDGIIRIEFAAGKAAKQEVEKSGKTLEESASLLNCEIHQVPARAEELFAKWKDAVKKGKKVESPDLKSEQKFEGNEEEILRRTAEILKTQPEHIPKTIRRFLDELGEKLK